MENPDIEGAEVARVSSCRGVSFEINPNRVNIFAIESQNPQFGHWIWVPWSQKLSPGNNSSERSRSRSQPSNHFCDFDDQYSVTLNKLFEEEDNEKKKNYNTDAFSEVQHKRSRLSVLLLDQGLFTVYKRLFLLCLTLNVILLVLAVTDHFPYAKKKAALFSIGNILALTMCRSEALLRTVFWLAVKLFGHPWMPLRIKTAVTSFLQGLGGIHSGCGVSSIAWLVYALFLTLQDRENTSPEIIGVATAILAMISLSSLAAFPLFRHLHHNTFERTHRFAGWTALAFLWVFIILTKMYNPSSKRYHFHISNLLKEQEFWLTIGITVLIILPWLTIRRVRVTVSAPSVHASIIKFEGGVEAGILGRISPSPLSEWHAFGIISDGSREHMMLAGAVGDFTKSLVSNPPSHLWVRRLHFAGLPYLVNMYERVVLVATGSGICVFLSFLLQPCPAEVCLVWVAKGIEQNFGNEIKEMVSRYPEDKLIVHDSAVSGRPNVAEISVAAAKKWRAEVVIVTSNPEGTRDVVRECKKAGIAAFGPIWDS